MADAASTSGEMVLQSIDHVLREKPDRVTHDFSAAMRCLTAYRDEVTRRLREKGHPPASLERLAKLNAVISSLYGAHYPIGVPPWALLEMARTSFAELAAEFSAAGEA
jgi:hypothetical protein